MEKTQFDRLLADVGMLCGLLKRPVSSKDLLRYYRQHPESRPLLLQRLGQVLLKMARVRSKSSTTRIKRIGIIENLTFYAPDNTEAMRGAFVLYSAQVAIAQQCRFRLPDFAIRLIGTRLEGMARNALAGYVEEWSPVVALWQEGEGSPMVHEMRKLLATAEQHAASRFIKVVPDNLVRRDEAEIILREEYGKRSPGSETATMNVNRHLVHLSWPQSQLFSPLPNLFWADQVKAYCASRWPVTSAEHELGRGLSLVMIYGPGE